MPKRDANHMQAQRERILRAAIYCISNVGLERTSVSAISKEAGLSAGALYNHFASKDAIVAEALRFAAMTEEMLPANWATWKADITSFDDQMGFSVETIARAKAQLLANIMRPGELHDVVKPLNEASLAMLATHLEKLAARGEVALKMTPRQTVQALSAVADGIVLLGLSLDRPLSEIADDIAAAVDCLVTSRAS
jgi:AcrR family transcriptional regulator